MKLLAIDTSTKTLCVGLYDGVKEYEYNVDYGTRLSRYLVPAIGRVLETAGVEVRAVDHFACGLGPGSFTGIRIGMACVKGLAWSFSAPVAGVPSLDVLALNARREPGVIAAVLDAKRGLVYAAFYSMKKERLVRLSPYLLVSPLELMARMRSRAGKRKLPFVFCGDGIPVIRGHAADAEDARFLDQDHWKPQGRHLLELAREKIARKDISDAVSITPLYLYPKECQIRK
jgi:tRNA threonylcarbamoyladenosine biosynthesis protein TsaB